jgi:hypothetical protein
MTHEAVDSSGEVPVTGCCEYSDQTWGSMLLEKEFVVHFSVLSSVDVYEPETPCGLGDG